MTYPAPPAFKRPKQPSKPSRPQQSSSFRPKGQIKLYPSNRKDYAKRSRNQKHFSSSKQASSSTKFWSPTLSTAGPTTSRYSSVRKVGPFCGTMGRTDEQQVSPLYRPKRVQDPIQVSSSLIGCSDKFESIFLPVVTRRNRGSSQKTGSGKGSESGNSSFYSRLFLVPKKNGKLCPVIGLSLLNHYMYTNNTSKWRQSSR